MTKSQWDTYADLIDKNMGNSGDRLHKTIIEPIILSFIQNIKNPNVLDVGCGNGFLLRKLSLTSVSVVGIDSSDELVKKAKRQIVGIDNVSVKYSDIATQLPFHKETFDIVIASMVLQYLPNIDIFALEAYRTLKQGGILVVIIDHPSHVLFERAGELMGHKSKKFIDCGSYFEIAKKRKRSLWNQAELYFYHRPMQEYLNSFSRYFKLETMKEKTLDNEVPRICGFKWVRT